MNKFLNVFTIAAVVLVLLRQGPIWLNNFNQEGKLLHSQSVEKIPDASLEFPPPGKSAAIFWATWCGPCKIEMQRLKNSVLDGKIDAQKIYAINPFEPKEVVAEFIKQERFPFIFIEAPEVVKALGIELTPTTVLIENNKVHSLKSGMSFIGIFTLENFLN